MKLFFTFFIIVTFGQLHAQSDNFELHRGHDDRLFILGNSDYGAQFNFSADSLVIDSCLYVPKLWTFGYDTNQEKEWYSGYYALNNHLSPSSDLIYHDSVSSKVAHAGLFRFHNGQDNNNSELVILSLNHQTGTYKPIIAAQTTTQFPVIYEPELNGYPNGDWLLSGALYSNGDFYFNDTSTIFSSSSSFSNAFIIKFDGNTNNVLWTNEVSNSPYSGPTIGIAPNGETYVCGARLARSTTILGNQTLPSDVDSSVLNKRNLFIGKIDSAGQVTEFKDLIFNALYDLNLEGLHFSDDAYFLTGTIVGSASFDSINIINGDLNLNNGNWVFVAKYDMETDSLIWVRHSYNSGGLMLTASTLDQEENVYIGISASSQNWSMDSLQWNSFGHFVVKIDSTGSPFCIPNIPHAPIKSLLTNQTGEIFGLKGSTWSNNYALFSIDNCQYNEIDAFSFYSCFLSTKNQIADDFVKIYPNPTTNFIHIELDNSIHFKEVFYKVYNATGQLLIEKKLDNFQEKVNMQHFSSGIYFVQILTENGLITKKVIKN